MQYLDAQRLRIYLGEDKRHNGHPLHEAIVAKARSLAVAGLTVFRGSQGCGHSTRLHSAEVLFSEDLPLVIELIDYLPRLQPLIDALLAVDGLGLLTLEPVHVLQPDRLEAVITGLPPVT